VPCGERSDHPEGVTTAILTLVATGADCERLHGGWLAQPVNAWSSLAFLVAGAWIMLRAIRGDHGRTPELAAFAVAVAANAAGSFLYHGVHTTGAHWLHDIGIYAVLGFVAVHDAGTVLGWPRRRIFLWWGALLAFTGIVRAATPGATDAISAALAAAAAFGEFAAMRAGLRPRLSDGFNLHLAAWLLAIAAVVTGGVSFLLGSSVSPLCAPESPMQWHAAWHVLQALAMVAYAYAAVELWSPTEAPARFRGSLPGSARGKG
jgi:hypothetical protein